MGAHLIRDFTDIGLSDRSVAGGKGAGLGELTRAGIRVPPGFVVTTAAFDRALTTAGPIRRRIEEPAGDDHESITRVTAGVRDLIENAPLPEDVRTAIAERYRALGADARGGRSGQVGRECAVAVRSSATGEDAADASFAGLQDTYLWVRGTDEVIDHVRKCWASLYSDRAVSYRRQRNLREDNQAMGVVVQRMVDAHAAGVMFTRSPTTGDRSVVAIEACWGLGSALVSGDVTPDSYVVNKVTGEIVKRRVPAKLRRHRRNPGGSGILAEAVPEELRNRPCLGDDEIRALVEIGRRAEDHYGAPQDIEWVIARDLPPGENLFLLQSRPETVWAGRAAEPVAAPKPRAFDHVLDSLGGGAPADRGAAD
jgi:pyruvate,water dikinase